MLAALTKRHLKRMEVDAKIALYLKRAILDSIEQKFGDPYINFL